MLKRWSSICCGEADIFLAPSSAQGPAIRIRSGSRALRPLLLKFCSSLGEYLSEYSCRWAAEMVSTASGKAFANCDPAGLWTRSPGFTAAKPAGLILWFAPFFAAIARLPPFSRRKRLPRHLRSWLSVKPRWTRGTTRAAAPSRYPMTRRFRGGERWRAVALRSSQALASRWRACARCEKAKQGDPRQERFGFRLARERRRSGPTT